MRQQPWRDVMRGESSRAAGRGRDREGGGLGRSSTFRARTAVAPSVSAALAVLMVLTGAVGVPTAAAAAGSGVSVDTFDDAAPRVSTITGSATPSRSTDAAEGEAALAVAYDVTDGMGEVAYPAASAPAHHQVLQAAHQATITTLHSRPVKKVTSGRTIHTARQPA